VQISAQTKSTVKVYPQGAQRGTAFGSREYVVQRQRIKDKIAKLKAPFHATPAERRARLLRLLREDPGAGGDTQARRLLRALRTGPITSQEARHYLDVIHPAGRIKTLRDQGHVIDTRWVLQLSACGRPHRVGEYVLMHEGA
jgi:hypothetical protein